jgi:hypothetical protein
MDNIWVFLPQRSFKETLEWKTEILSAKSADQTISLRTIPRTELSLDYIFSVFEIETAIEMVRQHNGSKLRVPFWHDSETIGQLAALDTSFSVDTTMSPYKIGSEVLVYEYDGSKFEVLTVSAFTASTLDTSATPLVNSYTKALIMPLYAMNIKGAFKYKKRPSDHISGSITFISSEGYTTTAESTYPVLEGSFLLDERFSVTNSIQDSQYRDMTTFDNISGEIDQNNTKTYNTSRTVFNTTLDSKLELFEFRKWCNFVKGKSTSFYTPRWTKDFEVTRDIETASPYLFVRRGKYFDNEYLGYVSVILKDGTIHNFNITLIESFDIDEDRLTLEANAGVDITYTDIYMCTRIIKSRLNTDRIEINHIHNELAESSMSLIEVV